MIHYIVFFIRCARKKFRFLKYSTEKKSRILHKNGLYFIAGLLYKKLGQYLLAAQCFTSSKAYLLAIKCYEKQGLHSEAIQLAEMKKYYRTGAMLCENIHSEKKAAFFYSFFNLPLAIKLYKKNAHYYEAGLCYMKQYKFSKAIDCFNKCQEEHLKLLGLRQVEETAITLFLVKEYADACELFIKLHDYFSALRCAKKLRNPQIIKDLTLLVAYEEYQKKNFAAAAKYIAPYDNEKALLYHYMEQAKVSASPILNQMRFSA